MNPMQAQLDKSGAPIKSSNTRLYFPGSILVSLPPGSHMVRHFGEDALAMMVSNSSCAAVLAAILGGGWVLGAPRVLFMVEGGIGGGSRSEVRGQGRTWSGRSKEG